MGAGQVPRVGRRQREVGQQRLNHRGIAGFLGERADEVQEGDIEEEQPIEGLVVEGGGFGGRRHRVAVLVAGAVTGGRVGASDGHGNRFLSDPAPGRVLSSPITA